MQSYSSPQLLEYLKSFSTALTNSINEAEAKLDGLLISTRNLDGRLTACEAITQALVLTQPPSHAGQTKFLPKQGWAHVKVPDGSRRSVVHSDSPEAAANFSDDLQPTVEHGAASGPNILQNGGDEGGCVRLRYRRAVALGFEALDLIAAEGAFDRQMRDERSSQGVSRGQGAAEGDIETASAVHSIQGSIITNLTEDVTVVPEDAWSSEGSSSADDLPSAMDSLDHWPLGDSEALQEPNIPEGSPAADVPSEGPFEEDSSRAPPFSAHRLESMEAMANLSNFAVNSTMWANNDSDFTSVPVDGDGLGEGVTVEQHGIRLGAQGDEDEPMFSAVANFRALLEEALKS